MNTSRGISVVSKISPKGDIQVRSGGGIRQSSASPRSHCDGAPSASLSAFGAFGQTPGPSYPSDRTPSDANMKPLNDPSSWSSHSDLDRKESHR